MWRKRIWLAVGLMVVASAGTVLGQEVLDMGDGVTMEFLPVGNAGNTAHPDTGRGAVDSNYMIGKFEVTAAQYTKFLNAVAGVDKYGLYNSAMFGLDQSGQYYFGAQIQRLGSGTAENPYSYDVASEWANRPVNYVSWGDAARFVNWLHNEQPTGAQGVTTTEDGAYALNGAMTSEALSAVTRKSGARFFLPTRDEWDKAAFHGNDGVTGNYFEYPTSDDDEPSNLLTEPDQGNNATFNDLANGLTDDFFFRTEVGAHENSLSPYGTLDQGGNVWEWLEIETGDVATLRGGGWNSSVDSLAASGSISDILQQPGALAEESFYGFRVAAVPEPSSLVLLPVGALFGLFCWKRRKQ